MTNNDKRGSVNVEESEQNVMSRPADQTINLPRPTADQEQYLNAIQNRDGQYDPKVIIGRPRTK